MPVASIEGHYPVEGTERDAAREPLATVVVTLGNTCRHLDAAEVQTRAIAMLDQRSNGHFSGEVVAGPAVKVTHERLLLKML